MKLFHINNHHQNGVRTIAPEENPPRLKIGLELGGNFPRGQLS